MKIKILCILLLSALVYSCDDSTVGIGNGIMPNGDRIPANTDSYEFTTRSLLADSVYARTSTAYLGRYTDEQYGEFSADFMAQFTCPDDFEMSEDITSVKSVKLYLFYDSFFGDSLNAMRLQVDTLDKIIPEKDLSVSYTSINPKDYYNEKAKPLAVKAYSALGPSVDSVYTSGLVLQSIKLPNQLGEHLLSRYKENKLYFKDAEAFTRNVLKGIYVHCTHGDGTLLYINDIRLALEFNALTESSSGKKDSVVTISGYFAATKEVIQANHFENSEKLRELAEESEHTYLKTPAGIFTEATFPIADIYNEHKKDTLNGVSVTFTRYNDKSNTKYKMDVPQDLLMVRKKDMYSFFEENKIADSQTSFTCSYGSNNSYTFSNIAPLITYCIEERKNGIIAAGGNPDNENDAKRWEAQNPDWDKVVIIPVDLDRVESSSSGSYTIAGISNSLNMSSAKLKGGTDKLKMQIFYTTF